MYYNLICQSQGQEKMSRMPYGVNMENSTPPGREVLIAYIIIYLYYSIVIYNLLDKQATHQHCAIFSGQFLEFEFPSLKLSCLREERSFKVPVRLQPEADMCDTNLASISNRNKSSTLPFSGHLFTSTGLCAVPQVP